MSPLARILTMNPYSRDKTRGHSKETVFGHKNTGTSVSLHLLSTYKRSQE